MDDTIPKALRDRDQWVLWKYVNRDGKQTKVPFQIDGKPAESNNPETWYSYFAARAALELGEWGGLGFVFSEDDPFTGVDLDGCFNGSLDPWAAEIIKSMDSYTEWSPSKTGVHIVVEGKFCLPKGVNKRFGEKTGIEIYDHGRFFCVTGLRGKTCPHEPQPRQEQLDALAYKHFEDKVVFERARQYISKIDGAISGQRGHDITFKVACVLVLGFGLDEQSALSLLREWNTKCQPPWSESELAHKVRSADKQPGERNYLRGANKSDWDKIKVPEYKLAQGFGETIEGILSAMDSLDSTNRKTVMAALRGRYG